MSTVPGALVFLQPNPVLEISTGATANIQGQFAYALSGIDPKEVYDAANKMTAKMYEYPGFLFVNSDLFNHTPNLAGRYSARSGQAVRRFGDAHPYAAAQCLLAELQLPDQEAHRPVSGDPGSGRRRARGARKT